MCLTRKPLEDDEFSEEEFDKLDNNLNDIVLQENSNTRTENRNIVVTELADKDASNLYNMSKVSSKALTRKKK